MCWYFNLVHRNVYYPSCRLVFFFSDRCVGVCVQGNHRVRCNIGQRRLRFFTFFHFSSLTLYYEHEWNPWSFQTLRNESIFFVKWEKGNILLRFGVLIFLDYKFTTFIFLHPGWHAFFQFSAIFMLGFGSEPNPDERIEFLGKFYMGYSVLKII